MSKKTKSAFAFRDVITKILDYETKMSQVQKKFGFVEGGEVTPEQKKKFLASKDFAESESLSDSVDAAFNKLITKGFSETFINSGVDRIGAIEQSIRALSHDLKRVDFLIDRVENHCRRLMKYRTRCKPISKNFDRAGQLESHYLLLLSNLKGFKKLIKTWLSINKQTSKTAFNEELGIKLLLCRRQKKMSQDEVAKFLGITKAAYAHYERGRRETPILYVYRLAKFFNVTADYLLGLQGQSNSPNA